MGKKWKKLLVQRRANGRADMPSVRPEPVVSNSEMIERMEAVAPEPEVVEDEDVVASEAEVVVEDEPVVETPKPKLRRSTRRKKTTSED